MIDQELIPKEVFVQRRKGEYFTLSGFWHCSKLYTVLRVRGRTVIMRNGFEMRYLARHGHLHHKRIMKELAHKQNVERIVEYSACNNNVRFVAVRESATLITFMALEKRTPRAAFDIFNELQLETTHIIITNAGETAARMFRSLFKTINYNGAYIYHMRGDTIDRVERLDVDVRSR